MDLLPPELMMVRSVTLAASVTSPLEDAKHLEKLFAPVFVAQDLVNLPNYEIYLRLMIDGSVSKGFSAETVGPSR